MKYVFVVVFVVPSRNAMDRNFPGTHNSFSLSNSKTEQQQGKKSKFNQKISFLL